jgi:2',3'-cyclic-nucleotide 2'-phosphodiesterase (5'-nucleotidase family)
MKRLFLFLAGFLAFSCQELIQEPSDDGVRPGEYTLPVIETTDVHGYIVNVVDGTIHYRMAFVADKVKDIRGDDRERILLLDGGDLYQGASISNLQEGRPVYVSMDKMGYDAVALGNHEFDWGFDNMVDADATLPDYDERVNLVPVLCANLYRDGSRVSATKDYVILEKKAVNPKGESVKVKIGVVGFAINYAGSIMTSKFTGQGFSIRDDYSIANEIAQELESTGQCDATILLIHGAADTSAEKLGTGSAFDLVLGGHSHQTMSGVSANGIPYIQGGRYCQNYAYADLRFSVDDSGNISFKSVNNVRTPEVNSYQDIHTYEGQNANNLDSDILAVSDAAVQATSAQLEDVIGYITTGANTYSIDCSGGRASAMANWMCDILRRIGEADVAFVNGGGVRTYISLNGQSRRDITVANVYEMFPFNNTTYVYRLTYQELLRVFEYSMTSGGESLFTSMTGIDCYFTQKDYGTYTTSAVHSLKKDGTVIYENGQWTGDWASRSITLAVSEYLATNQRVDYYTNLENPLLEWNETSRLLYNDLVDNENAIRVLREEAASSGGHLYIDTAPHFILK